VARGRQLGYPTANVEVTGLLVPDGVYAGWVEAEGRLHDAAINVGSAQTFGGSGRRVEAHLLDYRGDLYGLEVTVWFLERLREERRFPDAEALRAQIGTDVARARDLLGVAGEARETLRDLQA
jgi:riboflavin kinase/FMN adenylyltransferase